MQPHIGSLKINQNGVKYYQSQVAENNLEADERGLWKWREVIVWIYIYTIDLYSAMKLSVPISIQNNLFNTEIPKIVLAFIVLKTF